MRIKYIRGYDGLRAFSILLVISNHLGSYDYLSLSSTSFKSMRIWPLIAGTTGVNIFFALSGFLITMILLSELELKGRIDYKRFFIRRFLRLTPPMIVFCLLLFLLMFFHFLPSNYLAVVISGLYLSNFAPNIFFTNELSHTWSLAVEEQFYLSWPFLLTKFSAKRIIWVICFGFIFLCIAAVYIFKLLYIPYVYNGKTFSLFQDGFRPMHFFIPAAAPIIIGSMGALLLFKKNNLLTKYFTGNYKILFLSIVIYASSLFLPVFLLPIFLILNSFGVTAFLLWLYCNQQSRLAAVLEAKPLVYIGKISYGLYIYQGVFLRTSPGGHLLIQQFPVNLLLTCIVAIASYHLLEKRMLRLKSRFQ